MGFFDNMKQEAMNTAIKNMIEDRGLNSIVVGLDKDKNVVINYFEEGIIIKTIKEAEQEAAYVEHLQQKIKELTQKRIS